MKMVLASKNNHKLKEMQDILSAQGVEVVLESDVGADVDVEETGATFEENALLKAKAVMEATGLPAIADDSGLCVDALGGAPGVYSARYGGPGLDDVGRYRLLLENMKGQLDRRCKFVSAICCCFPNGDTVTARGECRGTLAYAPRGADGFGYDPIFFVPELKKTFAELLPEEKNAISHRGNALAIFKDRLAEYRRDHQLCAAGKGRLNNIILKEAAGISRQNTYGFDKQAARPAQEPCQQHRHHCPCGQGRPGGESGQAGRRRTGGPGAHQRQGFGELHAHRPGGGRGAGRGNPERGCAGDWNKIRPVSSKS